jgi:hypothetical protein
MSDEVTVQIVNTIGTNKSNRVVGKILDDHQGDRGIKKILGDSG